MIRDRGAENDALRMRIEEMERQMDIMK